MSYRFILEPYKTIAKSRHDCPYCGHKKEFTRYIDKDTGEYLADHVGMCNRDKCSVKHYTPKSFFSDNPDAKEKHSSKQDYRTDYRMPPERDVKKPEAISYIPEESIQQSLRDCHRSHLYQFFARTFSQEVANSVFASYFVGASKHWQGATAFCQIDIAGNVRHVKVMAYNPENGKRVKKHQCAKKWDYKQSKYLDDIDNGDKVYFAGKSILRDAAANLMQCFFGEHLLKLHPNKPVAVVESEKSALIASVFLPEYVWIATGGKNGCKWTDREVNKVLAGRVVCLFPDLGTFERKDAKGEKEVVSYYQLWQEKATTICGAEVSVSDILQKQALEDEINNGFDLADYLLRDYDYAEIIIAEFKERFESVLTSTEAAQYRILNDYISKGLTAKNAKQVFKEFIAEGVRVDSILTRQQFELCELLMVDYMDNECILNVDLINARCQEFIKNGMAQSDVLATVREFEKQISQAKATAA